MLVVILTLPPLAKLINNANKGLKNKFIKSGGQFGKHMNHQTHILLILRIPCSSQVISPPENPDDPDSHRGRGRT